MNLLDFLERRFPGDKSIDKNKIKDFIINEYSDYYGNILMDFCILNCDDSENNKETSGVIVKELAEDPRMSNDICKLLINKLGGGEKGKSLFATWFYDENYGYQKAYQEYYNEDFLPRVKSMNKLVKQSPNIAPWFFVDFAKQNNLKPELGKLPKEFEGVFNELIERIKQFSQKQNKYKNKNIKVNQSFTISIGDKKFDVSPINEGRSAKLKFTIVPYESPNSSYILKLAQYNAYGGSGRSKKIRENQAMRPDMPYLNALIDFYLKENNSKNAPDIKYFDYDNQAVLYETSIGSQADFPSDDVQNLYKIRQNIKISDIYDLGVILNDIKNENFIISERDGEYKIIDNGHTNFKNIFRPIVIGKQIGLGNLCGRE